jgi:predicted ArsR family transcriptional regulator
MDILDAHDLLRLADQRGGTRISIFLPTHRSWPQTERNRIRLKNQLKHAHHADGGHTGYELLSGILAEHRAGDRAERVRRAEQAGWAWPGQRAAGPAAGAATPAEATVHVNAVFAELGFDPDLARDGDSLEIRLHACPFRAVAATHPEMVCSVHLGLLRRTLADVDAPPAAVSLQPFVQPHLCLAQITPATAPVQGRQVPPWPGVGGQP